MPSRRLTLCLLPGLDGSGLLYQRLAARLANEFDIRILDYPADNFDGYDRLAEQLLPRLPSKGFVLIAESFAGPLAVKLATHQPAGLKALILAASFAHRPIAGHAWLRSALAWAPAIKPPARWLLPLLMNGHPDEWLQHQLRSSLKDIAARVLKARAQAALEADVREQLVGLRLPVLCLAADSDRLIRASAAQQIVQLCADAELVRIKAPHFVFQTAPADCASAICEYLQRRLAGAISE